MAWTKEQHDHEQERLKPIRIRNWKKRGLVHENYNELHKKYVDAIECELCKSDFKSKFYSSWKCLMFDFKIVCSSCCKK